MQTITIKVTPNAKTNSITKENNILKIRVTAPAINNKANKAVIQLLSKHLKINKSKIKIIKGIKSKEKIINIKK